MTGIFSWLRSFVSTSSSSEFTMGWQEKKEWMLSLPQDDRQKEYWCGDDFVPLESVNTWAKDELYNSKLNNAKNQLHRAQKNKIENQVLEGLKIDQSLDLSKKVSIYEGDITKLEIDAIVNAANESLLGGGGVDGAIHRAAGKWLRQENVTLNGCEAGEAKISGGYRLPAKYVVSTVGPRGERPEILERAYRNSLQKMVDNGLKSIAFPCISTGIFGYPNEAACCVALRTVRRFLEIHHENVDRVVFCLFLPVDIEIYKQRMPIIFPSTLDGEGLAESQEKDVSTEKQDEGYSKDKHDGKGSSTEKQDQDQDVEDCIEDEKKEDTTGVGEKEGTRRVHEKERTTKGEDEGMDRDKEDQMKTTDNSPKL